MVRSIKEIGHVMGKIVIAESVESEAALEKLREIGVDYAQGFVIGGPKPLTEVGSVSVADVLGKNQGPCPEHRAAPRPFIAMRN